MYRVETGAAFLRGHAALLTNRRLVGRNVVLLGVVSLLTDVSSEMVASTLPLYFLIVLGLSPLAFGVLDGWYRGASALVSIVAGISSDRLRRHKEVAMAGYGLSALCKPLYIVAGAATSALGAVVILDRIGKGIRTAPRDALISLSTPARNLGTAFGVHRALDTTGAMLGPLVAFGILALAPDGFDAIFMVSFCVAILGVAVLALFVNGRPHVGGEPEVDRPDTEAFRSLLRNRPLVGVLVAAGLLNLATISDAFIYLGLQRNAGFDESLFPLLFVGTAAAYMVLSIPVGRLADRIGRGKVVIAGYLLLLPLYLWIIGAPDGVPAIIGSLLLFGSFYAATDGVLTALTSAIIPRDLRGSGIAALQVVTGLARIAGSVVFGALWLAAGLQVATLVFAIALVLAIAVSVPLLRAAHAHA